MRNPVPSSLGIIASTGCRTPSSVHIQGHSSPSDATNAYGASADIAEAEVRLHSNWWKNQNAPVSSDGLQIGVEARYLCNSAQDVPETGWHHFLF